MFGVGTAEIIRDCKYSRMTLLCAYIIIVGRVRKWRHEKVFLFLRALFPPSGELLRFGIPNYHQRRHALTIRKNYK